MKFLLFSSRSTPIILKTRGAGSLFWKCEYEAHLERTELSKAAQWLPETPGTKAQLIAGRGLLTKCMVLGESLTQKGEQATNPAVFQMLWECKREIMTDVLVSVS